MKKLLFIISIIIFTMIGVTTTIDADITKGQKIFKKNFRKACRFSGVKFARYHTQDEWKELYKSDKFKEEVKKICPRLKLEKIKDNWWLDLYDFAHEYGSDSLLIPNC